ncbi:DUF4399 domain-containing protein [Halalkalicoccus jeotgali]|uniref:DUF4399 domain-containing protein n=1 Tax=Halalkalicoccus jeotgali TaxID=413810 RepID=UPI0009D93AAC|nr:DUF4399 domain-containing protein [Halalkalicoccus jeotgali]
MQEELPRRAFITSTAIGIAAIAGCTQSDSEGTNSDNSAPADDNETTTSEEPSVPEDANITLSVPTAADLDGLQSPLMAFFDAENFTVEPAGEPTDGAGHFHVMVDTSQVEPGETIPNDDQHLHFGDGAEHTVLDLEPGEHELTLQMGDGEHTALPLVDTQTVTVEERAAVSLDAPQDGDVVSTDETITFKPVVDNFVIEQAGELTQNAGHHHLLVNTDPVSTGTVIPSDDQHIHFGNGTEMPEIDASELGAGEYELIIQIANGVHEAYPLTTDPITITIEE